MKTVDFLKCFPFETLYKIQKNYHKWNIESYNDTHANKYWENTETKQVKIWISLDRTKFLIHINLILILSIKKTLSVDKNKKFEYFNFTFSLFFFLF